MNWHFRLSDDNYSQAENICNGLPRRDFDGVAHALCAEAKAQQWLRREQAMLTFYILQGLVPLALVVWLAVAPPQSVIGFWTQALATAIGIVAIGLVGLWVVPPWWTPWALAAFLMAMILADFRRQRRTLRWPDGILGWLGLVSFVALGLFATNQARVAAGAMRAPVGDIIDLASPLGPGTYLVANGGAALSLNAHYEVLEASVPAHRPWRGEAYAVDIVAIDGWGLRADGVVPSKPNRYHIFGRPVVAPCAGEVVVAVDGFPDMIIPEADPVNLAGNHVFLRCGPIDIVLGHFRKGSVRVHVGQLLAIGAPIAEVGNSGNTSEPHLHIHAQMPGTVAQPFSGAPIPIRIDGRFLVRNECLVVTMANVRP